jgi:hypothetical protein
VQILVPGNLPARLLELLISWIHEIIPDPHADRKMKID